MQDVSEIEGSCSSEMWGQQMTSVNSGIIFEYKIRDYLKATGYNVIRSAGSKGPIDLFAWQGNHVEVIQCKKGSSPLQADIEKLTELEVPLHWKKRIWKKNKSKVHIIDIPSMKETILSITDINKVIKDGQ